jgi:hypothetical protein
MNGPPKTVDDVELIIQVPGSAQRDDIVLRQVVVSAGCVAKFRKEQNKFVVSLS